MTPKPKKPTPKPRTVARNVPAKPPEQTPDRRNLTPSEILARPTVLGLVATKAAAKGLVGDVDDMELHSAIREQVKAIAGGDMAPVEAMLYSQAKALEVLFTRLLHRGMGCDNIAPFQANMAMALKAQAQCRATLQTLVEAKQPRAVAFVKQANIAQQQQVNNAAPVSHARTEESPKPANEQSRLEAPNEWSTLDTGATAAPARGNPEVETVGAVHRAEDTRGEGEGGEQ